MTDGLPSSFLIKNRHYGKILLLIFLHFARTKSKIERNRVGNQENELCNIYKNKHFKLFTIHKCGRKDKNSIKN